MWSSFQSLHAEESKADERGETIVEYVMMLAVILLLTIIATVTIGDQASKIFLQVGRILFGAAN
jgi:Flp pilus assembly pilin Flp